MESKLRKKHALSKVQSAPSGATRDGQFPESHRHGSSDGLVRATTVGAPQLDISLTPLSLVNLDEIGAPRPADIEEARPTLEDRQGSEKRRQYSETDDTTSSVPSNIGNLDEIAAEGVTAQGPLGRDHDTTGKGQNRRLEMVYMVSYLIFFAIFGTLARLGLQAITIYPGAPVALGELWANVGGTAIMGFLSEDRSLFLREVEAATERAMRRKTEEGNNDERAMAECVRKEHMAAKKQIPLYVGLTVGFCGCFTTFSSFMRDVFLALSNDLNTGLTSTAQTTSSRVARNDGRGVEACLAVLILEVSACLTALDLGAHVAIAVEPVLSRIPRLNSRLVLDPLVVVLGWGAWVGAVVMAIWPPEERWRGQAVFAVVLAPAGCLARFYLSLRLNGLVARFPLGTFAANTMGTLVLGGAWDIQHAAIGGRVGCQVLQGVQDGFCGSLTTVSTWVLELKGLRRRHAYVYGASSVAAGLGLLVAVMGSLRWTDGFSAAECSA